jgi:hypothetical protein
MKNLWIGALLLAMAPTIALADRGSRYDGRHYDRGERYYGRSSGSRSSFGFSFGIGNSGYHGRDYSYTHFRYSSGRPSYGYGHSSRHYTPHYRTHYYAPAPVYIAPAPVYVAPPPVVYYPAPRTYYYGGSYRAPSHCYTPRSGYHVSGGYYYGR